MDNTKQCLIILSKKPGKILYYTHCRYFKAFLRNTEIDKKTEVVLLTQGIYTQPVQGG